MTMSEPRWTLEFDTFAYDEGTICHLFEVIPLMAESAHEDGAEEQAALLVSCLKALQEAFDEQAIDGGNNSRIKVTLNQPQWKLVEELLS